MATKLIYILIDGVGDHPSPALGGKTPLEYAETPNMDSLARNAKLGLVYTVKQGIAPESDVAVLSMLGYDPFKYHTGRGPIEAYGAGIPLKDGDLAIRCNFATASPNGKILDRRVGRSLSSEEAAILSEAVNRLVRLESYPASFTFKSTIGHRAALVIRSTMPLSSNITNTDPSYAKLEGLGVAKTSSELKVEECKPLDDSEPSKISAQLVNEFTVKSRSVLEEHQVNLKRVSEGKLKANVILTRDAGNRLPKLFNINERYGARFACLAEMPVEVGIAKLAGMEIVHLPPPTGSAKTDSERKVEALLNAYQSYDCFYVHIKGPDEPGHDGNAKLKAEVISVIDEVFFGRLLKALSLDECVVCVTADHATPCDLKAHSDDPVPLLVTGGGVKGRGASRFCESSCGSGELGLLSRGVDLMPMLMKLLGRG